MFSLTSFSTRQPYIWPRGYKAFFMPNSAEHEIFSANKYENANKVGIFIFISREIFVLSYIVCLAGKNLQLLVISDLIAGQIFMLG